MSEQNFRVVIIGAGMAGVLAAIKLQKAGYTNVVIYEKADRVGGTWRENTYPGLTCDVPSHHYTYSFEKLEIWDSDTFTKAMEAPLANMGTIAEMVAQNGRNGFGWQK